MISGSPENILNQFKQNSMKLHTSNLMEIKINVLSCGKIIGVFSVEKCTKGADLLLKNLH